MLVTRSSPSRTRGRDELTAGGRAEADIACVRSGHMHEQCSWSIADAQIKSFGYFLAITTTTMPCPRKTFKYTIAPIGKGAPGINVDSIAGA